MLPTQPETVTEDAARASARVIEGAVNLAKAEVHLGLSQAKLMARKAAIGAALLWLAMSFTQVAITLICLSPLLITIWDLPFVGIALALAIGLSTLFGVIGGLRLRSAFAPREIPTPKSEPSDTGIPGHAMYPRGI